MTTPAPALTALLDELDRLRTAATPGEWRTSPDWQWGIESGGEVVASAEAPVDAALIVAEHAAVPKLTAAVRAALALHKPYDLPLSSERLCDHDEFTWPCATFTAIAAALEVKP